MRYWLVGVGVACLIFLGASMLCSGPRVGQGQTVAQANDDCTHYVNNWASTDGDGSLSMPWNNIAGHVNDLAPGDVMCVRGSTTFPGRVYTGPVISLDGNAGTLNGTAEAPITVRTYPGEHVVLQSSGVDILDFIAVAHWQLDGFTFDKQSKGGYAVHFGWANYNVVRNCEIYDGSGEGIHFTYGEYNVVENCKIHDFDSGPYKDAHGILLAGGKGNVIRRNEIYDCTGDGIQFYAYHTIQQNIIEYNHFYTTLGQCSENAVDVKVGSPVIQWNVMHGYRPNDGSCGGSGGAIGEAIIVHRDAANVLIVGNEIYDSGSGMLVYTGDNVEIVNNFIHDIIVDYSVWTNIGIYVSGVESVDILNNTLVNIPRQGLRTGEGHIGDLDIRNNLFYGTGLSFRRDSGTQAVVDYNGWFSVAGRIEGAHDVVGFDPRFVSPGNYHLRGSSPAVDRGDNVGAPAYDFDASPRPYGPAVDLGAFEVQEPVPVSNLQASEGITVTGLLTVTLTWATPGRVGQSSTADHYELRYVDQVITEEIWDQAALAEANIAAGSAGVVQQIMVGLPWDGSGHVYFALRVFDAGARRSEVSNPAFWPMERTFLPFVARRP